MATRDPNHVIHRSCEIFRDRVHVVLVAPEVGGNVGAAARALGNMGIRGQWHIVGTDAIIDSHCRKRAKHAAERLNTIRFHRSLADVFATKPARSLTLAATARAGSAARPHPVEVRPAVQRAVDKLIHEEVEAIYLVFGCEGAGLSNEDVALCDWVVTIPSSDDYRSLNLSQAVLLFTYEVHTALLEAERVPEVEVDEEESRQGQRDRLITHMLRIAEDVGFILPNDPLKMRPRLEEIFSQLPKYVKDARTLHGLLHQISRTVRKGEVDIKGRFKNFMEVANVGRERKNSEQ